MDKLKLTGQTLCRVFYSKLGRVCICSASAPIAKWPNLKLKTQPKQLLGSLSLAFALPAWTKLSTLDVFMLTNPIQLPTQQKQPNLNMKTQPKQLLDYLPLALKLSEYWPKDTVPGS